MAKVTVEYTEAERPIKSVGLTLSLEEAKTIVSILRRVGGCPDKSPRKHAQNILEELESNGIRIGSNDLIEGALSYKNGRIS